MKLCTIVFLSLALSACTLGKKTNDIAPSFDAFETEKLAAAAYEKGDWVESEKHYTALARKIPQEVLPWFRLGNIYARTQRPDAAISAYREALIRDQNYANAWYNLAIVQLKQSANSFNEMQIFIDPQHALYEKSRRTLEGILDLIKGDDSN